MKVSDFSMLWTPKLDSVGGSYNGQLSRLHRTPSVHPSDNSIQTPSIFPFLDKPSEFQHVSIHHLWTTSYLTGPGALLFLSPSISVPLCQFRPIHPSICQLQQLRTLSVWPKSYG